MVAFFARDKNKKDKKDKKADSPNNKGKQKQDETISKKAHPPLKPRIGLALGSGLARGFSHIGVVRALKRHGIEPTIVSGTSMGALVGGAYLSGNLDAVEAWAHSLNRMKVMSYLDFRVRSGGIFGGKKLMKLMYDNFGDVMIEDLPQPFIAIAADMTTGHEVWLRKGRLIDIMRASFSLPGIFPPVYMNNRWLIDGALVNPVPVSVCQALDARMTIAVNPNGDILGKAAHPGENIPTVAGFDLFGNEDTKGSMQATKAKKSSITRRIFTREKDAPSMFGVMVSSLNIIQDRLARSRLAGDPPDVTITPRIGHIGLMEFDRADELIEEGEAAVERALPDIKAAYSVLCTNYIPEDDEK